MMSARSRSRHPCRVLRGGARAVGRSHSRSRPSKASSFRSTSCRPRSSCRPRRCWSARTSSCSVVLVRCTSVRGARLDRRAAGGRAARARVEAHGRRLMPTAAHFLYIPGVLLVGIVIGWILGSRAAADAYAAENRRQEARAARAQDGTSPAPSLTPDREALGEHLRQPRGEDLGLRRGDVVRHPHEGHRALARCPDAERGARVAVARLAHGAAVHQVPRLRLELNRRGRRPPACIGSSHRAGGRPPAHGCARRGTAGDATTSMARCASRSSKM